MIQGKLSFASTAFYSSLATGNMEPLTRLMKYARSPRILRSATVVAHEPDLPTAPPHHPAIRIVELKLCLHRCGHAEHQSQPLCQCHHHSQLTDHACQWCHPLHVQLARLNNIIDSHYSAWSTLHSYEMAFSDQ